MSLLSAVILPALEKQLAEIDPEVANFALSQLEKIAAEIMNYVKDKNDCYQKETVELQQGNNHAL